MAVEDLRNTEEQVTALIGQGLQSLGPVVEGQQVHRDAAQACAHAAEQGDVHRLYAARAIMRALTAARELQKLNQRFESLLGSLPADEVLNVIGAAQAGSLSVAATASLIENAEATLNEHLDGPAILQEASGQIGTYPHVAEGSRYAARSALAAGRTVINGL